jgi:hypothetical protein
MESLSSRSEPSSLAALGVVLEYECARDEKCKRRHLLVGTTVDMDQRGLQADAITHIKAISARKHTTSRAC